MSETHVFLHTLINQLPEDSKWIVMQQFKYQPQARIYSLLLQLEQDILRKVLVKKGKDSEDYKFFQDIVQVLYQAGEAVHVIERLNQDLMGLKQYNEYLHQRNAKLEQEVTRWQTVEELAAQDLLEVYCERVKKVLNPNK